MSSLNCPVLCGMGMSCLCPQRPRPAAQAGEGQQALRFPLSIFTKTHRIPLHGALSRVLQEAQGQQPKCRARPAVPAAVTACGLGQPWRSWALPSGLRPGHVHGSVVSCMVSSAGTLTELQCPQKNAALLRKAHGAAPEGPALSAGSRPAGAAWSGSDSRQWCLRCRPGPGACPCRGPGARGRPP